MAEFDPVAFPIAHVAFVPGLRPSLVVPDFGPAGTTQYLATATIVNAIFPLGSDVCDPLVAIMLKQS